MSAAGTPWTLVSRIGIALFLIGFTLFLAAPFLGDFRLDPEGLSQAVEQAPLGSGDTADAQRRILSEELAPLADLSFGWVWPYLEAVDGELDQANERLRTEVADWAVLHSYPKDELRQALAKAADRGAVQGRPLLWLLLSIGLACLGGLLDYLSRIPRTQPGIQNHGVMFSSAKARGWVGIALGIFLIGFYVVLYFYPAYLTSWVRLADPASQALRGADADRWFFYGFLYTLTILVMGVRMLVHYRHSRYHLVRTLSVMFFQTGFAFLIPAILEALNRPSMDLKNAWPLNYSFFYGYNLETFMSSAFGWFLLLWGIGLSLLLIPLLAFFFGKRWYCSWVCGCGGLAETLGDPFRHLSDKGVKAWRVERWLVHAVLVFAVVMTAVVLINFFTGQDGDPLFAGIKEPVKTWYGFLIGSIFAGVVGTGFYPFMGNRVWCRFGCPLAAILGIVQRFKSRFRITTNGGQCISCGNCSTYCEMGIDVRAYAQRGQNIIRASCVGCGVCAAVCPRGVLRLETGPEEGRFGNESGIVSGEVRLVQIGQGRVETA